MKLPDIYIINESLRPSGMYGIGTFVKEFTSYLQQKNMNVTIIDVCSPAVELHVEQEGNLRTIQIPYVHNVKGISHVYYTIKSYVKINSESLFIFNHKEQYMLARTIRERHNDSKLIYVVHYFSWMWIVGIHGNILDYVNDENELNLALGVKDAFFTENEFMKIADNIVVMSEDAYQTVLSKYNIETNKIKLIPNGIVDRFNRINPIEKLELKTNLFIPTTDKIILYVGRLDILKGINSLISSFRSVVNLYSDCKLVIIGDGAFSEVITNIGNIASKIVFTGKLSKEELSKWYQIADIGVLPSYWEQCSYVGIEMMMYCLPIVASNGIGVRNMFFANDNAIVADCNNGKDIFDKELVNGIITLLTSKDSSDYFGKRSRECYLSRYQVDIMGEKYIKMVENLYKS